MLTANEEGRSGRVRHLLVELRPVPEPLSAEELRRREEELERLKALRTPTPAERLRERELKKRKLAGRDRIQRILGRTG